MPEKYPPDPTISRTAKDHASNRLLLLGIIYAYSMDASVLNIELSVERMLKMKLRKARGTYGEMNICKLSDFKLHQLRSILESITSSLFNKVDTKAIILETGCYISATGFRYKFVEGTMVQICHTNLMYVINAPLEEINGITLNYEVINDEGNVSIMEGTGIFMTELKFRLLIPQDNFMDLQRINNPYGSFTINWDKYFLKLCDQVPIIINYEHITHITMLHNYKSIYSTVESLDVTGYVTSEKNNYLTH